MQFTDMATKAVYPAIVYNFAVYHQGIDKMYYTIGDNTPISIDGIYGQNEQQIKVRSGTAEFVPYIKPQGQKSLMFVGEAIHHAGNYDILNKDDLIKKIAYNYYPKESELLFLNKKELNNIAKQSRATILQNTGIKATIVQADRGVHLWKWMLALALLFLLIEMLIHKYVR